MLDGSSCFSTIHMWCGYNCSIDVDIEDTDAATTDRISGQRPHI